MAQEERELDHLKVMLVEERRTKNTVVFQVLDAGSAVAGVLGPVGQQHISKTALKMIGNPKMITITIEPYEPK